MGIKDNNGKQMKNMVFEPDKLMALRSETNRI